MTKASRLHLWENPKEPVQIFPQIRSLKKLPMEILRHTLAWLGIRPMAAHHQSANSRSRLERLDAEITYRHLLLEEVIHRTKNTLQLAVAVLDEHIGAARDAWVCRDLRNVRSQLRALSRTHHRFYGPVKPDGESLNIRLSEICMAIFDSSGERGGRINLSVAVADVQLQRHQEICVSVILQELLMNTLKHAFPCGRRGLVSVRFDVDDESICHLVVQDDGVGRRLCDRTSTGLALIRSFASSLHGCCLESGSNQGATTTISFPLSAAT